MKNVILIAVGATSLLLGSCTVSHTAVVTNNPVGSRVGIAKAGAFQKDADCSYKAAMDKGKISKIGVAEVKMKVFIFPKITTTGTGE